MSGNSEMIDYWNAVAAQTWVKFQAQLDRQLTPLGAAALAALALRSGERVLDIGCGCGQTSLDLAVRGAHVTGVDISRPMLEVARARPVPPGAAVPEFLEADAQTAALGVFDAAFSRFGVMFFSDPVSAFANIRAALKPGGRLVFVCWRGLKENTWMRVPIEAAAAFLPATPPPEPFAPGPFAFADNERLAGILAQAGFRDVQISPFDTAIGGGDLEASVELALRVGPLGAALRENPGLEADIIPPLRAALASYATPLGVLLPAAVWIVRATN